MGKIPVIQQVNWCNTLLSQNGSKTTSHLFHKIGIFPATTFMILYGDFVKSSLEMEIYICLYIFDMLKVLVMWSIYFCCTACVLNDIKLIFFNSSFFLSWHLVLENKWQQFRPSCKKISIWPTYCTAVISLQCIMQCSC